MALITGTAGDDNLTGTFSFDSFDLTQGGVDTVKGKAGGDAFYLGAALTAADQLDAGVGLDALILAGDYSAGLAFGATTALNFETISFTAGNSYDITFRDATNSTPANFSVYGFDLLATDTLRFDGSAETSNGFNIYGGGGADTLIGGEGADSYVLYYLGGGNDVVSARGGGDFISMNETWNKQDKIDGGAGRDTIFLSGAYVLNLGPNTMRNIEAITLTDGYSYKLTLDEANVGPLGVLTVEGFSLSHPSRLIFNGSADTDGVLQLRGGGGRDALTGGGGDDELEGRDGADVLMGGAGDDFLTGGLGHDEMTGGAGQDSFFFGQGHSPFGNPDLISDLALQDMIHLSGIDADTTVGGDQFFTLAGAFTGVAGQLMLDYDAGAGVTWVLMDTDGDSAADGRIAVAGNRESFTSFEL